MSLEANKALVQRFIDEVFNTGNVEALVDFCVPGSMFAGGLAGQLQAMRVPFPDLQFIVDNIIAEGDKVVVCVSTLGTHTGPLFGLPAFGKLENPVPPTGQTVRNTGIYIFTVVDNKVVSYNAEMDQIGMLRQMGWSFTPPSPE